jgi:hypothetical protein
VAQLLQRESSVPAEVNVPNPADQHRPVSSGLMTKHKETLEEIQSMLQSLRDERNHQETKLSKLKTQNQQAAIMIQKISSQLKSKNAKYKTIRKQVVRLQTLHIAMDTNVRALQDSVKNKKNSKSLQATLDELQKHLQDVMELVASSSSSGTSLNSAGSLFSSDDTLDTKEMMMPFVNIEDDASRTGPDAAAARGRSMALQEEEAALEESLLVEAAKIISHSYESALADHVIRPPLTTTDSKSFWGKWNRLLSGLAMAQDVYAQCIHPEEPATWEIMARIKCDGSLLYLRDDANVMIYNTIDKEWSDYGNIDRRDAPLGWVVSNKGQDYSLDEVLEEAMIYRQQYCRKLVRELQLLQLPDWQRVLVDVKAKCVDSKVAHAFWLLAIPLAVGFQILKLIWSSLFW